MEDPPQPLKEPVSDQEIQHLLPTKGAADQVKLHHRILTDKTVYDLSMWAVRFGILADSINNTILRPNYPFLVLPNSHADSFRSTAPFGFGAAQYFLPMTSLLGSALASVFMGTLSDRLGRRPVLLVCVAMGAVGSIAKFFARGSFWGFCAANFGTGLFGATLSICMAYAGDVAPTRAAKDSAIGSLVGFYMIGATGGGIIAIVLDEAGLFTPLLVGASINTLSTMFIYAFMVEPKRLLALKVSSVNNTEEDNEEDAKAPTTIDWKVTANILIGSLADNAGSTGLLPFCLSPLAFNTFLREFEARGESPIMSENSYKWLSTLVAVMVIPSAIFSSRLFGLIGAPGACVLGNVLTAIVTVIILQLVLINPPSATTFGLFATFLYIGFPMTVISQLTTGPMLDAISPPDHRGMTQGLNSTAMNIGNAIFPFIFGNIADAIGVTKTVWICIGISSFAALVNTPLMFIPTLRRKPKPLPDYSRHVKGEDKDVVEKLLIGEWVHPQLLHDVNMERLKSGHHFLRVPIRTYTEDKEQLCELKRHAKEDFRFYKDIMAGFLNSADTKTPEKRDAMAKAINASHLDREQIEDQAKQLGQWFADYILDAGYRLDESPLIFKQMIMSAFPRVRPAGASIDMIDGDHMEEFALNITKVFAFYLEKEEAPNYLRLLAGRQSISHR